MMRLNFLLFPGIRRLCPAAALSRAQRIGRAFEFSHAAHHTRAVDDHSPTVFIMRSTGPAQFNRLTSSAAEIASQAFSPVYRFFWGFYFAGMSKFRCPDRCGRSLRLSGSTGANGRDAPSRNPDARPHVDFAGPTADGASSSERPLTQT